MFVVLTSFQGVYIHKSFSRVDRVARQLREVVSDQGDSTSSEQPPDTEDLHEAAAENHPCQLRSSYPGSSYHDYWISPQKAADAAGKHGKDLQWL